VLSQYPYLPSSRPQTHKETAKPMFRIQNLNAEAQKQIPVRITAHTSNLRNIHSSGKFCNKQHMPENCIIIEDYN
jgi:hypothetical protein